MEAKVTIEEQGYEEACLELRRKTQGTRLNEHFRILKSASKESLTLSIKISRLL